MNTAAGKLLVGRAMSFHKRLRIKGIVGYPKKRVARSSASVVRGPDAIQRKRLYLVPLRLAKILVTDAL